MRILPTQNFIFIDKIYLLVLPNFIVCNMDVEYD